VVLGVLMVFQAYMAEYAKSNASTSFLWGDSHDGRNFLVFWPAAANNTMRARSICASATVSLIIRRVRIDRGC
jgi:hypothetical protein